MIISILCFSVVVVLLYFLISNQPIRKEERKVIVVKFPLSENKDNVFKLLSGDMELLNHTTRHVRKLHNDKVEIFHRHSNIVVTEDGYDCIVYSDYKKKK